MKRTARSAIRYWE